MCHKASFALLQAGPEVLDRMLPDRSDAENTLDMLKSRWRKFQNSSGRTIPPGRSVQGYLVNQTRDYN